MKSPPSIFIRPWSLPAGGVFTFAVVLIALCGRNSLQSFSVIFLDGGTALLWFAAATALGYTLLRRLMADAPPTLTIATSAGVGLGIYSIAALCLGLIGWLSRSVALGFPIVSVVLFVGTCWPKLKSIKFDAVRPSDDAWYWLIPVASLTTAAVAASVMPGMLWHPDPHPYDVTSYHLQVPREWYELGRIVPLPHNVFSYFPFNVEMLYLLLMHAMGGKGGPWQAMYACQFVSVGYTILMLLAVASTGRPGGVAIASTVPWVVMLGSVCYVEPALMAYTAIAVAWAMRAVDRPSHGRRWFCSPMFLAGLAAGLGCSVKITAVPMLVVALAAAVLAAAPRLWKPAALFGVTAVVVVSPWLIRNTIWAGNPLFPVAQAALGRHDYTPGQIERFKTAHDKPPGVGRTSVLIHDVITHWQYGYVLLPLGLVAVGLQIKSLNSPPKPGSEGTHEDPGRTANIWAFGSTLRPGFTDGVRTSYPDPQAIILIITAIIVLLVWLGFTHLLPRFLVMLVPLAGIAIGRVTASWWRRVLPIAALAAVITGAVGVVPELYKVVNPPLAGPQHGYAMVGVSSLTEMMPGQVQHGATAGKQIGLVGDAQAFLYQVPTSQLHYRCVFDLPADESDPIDAWVGSAARGDRNWILVVSPSEIERLHRTYLHTPGLPPTWGPPERPPFVIFGDHPDQPVPVQTDPP